MRHALVTTVLFVFSSSMFMANAQQQLFKNYTVNDGLVSNSIRRIYQDKKGFLWIATWEGLSKYDGYKFTNFSTSNGLSHNLVNDFLETEDDQIILALNNGDIDVVKRGEAITNLVHSKFVINHFLKLPGKKIIALTDSNGLIEFDKGKFIQPTQDLPDSSFNSTLLLNDSLILAASYNTIHIFNLRYELYSALSPGTFLTAEPKIIQDSKRGSGLALCMVLIIGWRPPKRTTAQVCPAS